MSYTSNFYHRNYLLHQTLVQNAAKTMSLRFTSPRILYFLLEIIRKLFKLEYLYVNPFVPNAPFLYPLKTSENQKVLRCFQGVEKGCIGNEWVNYDLAGQDRATDDIYIIPKTEMNKNWNKKQFLKDYKNIILYIGTRNSMVHIMTFASFCNIFMTNFKLCDILWFHDKWEPCT